MNIFQPQRHSFDLDLEQDYISNLPQDVKEEVLMKLPIKEAVRTSVLSTKWKYAWMSIPNLVFKEDCAQSVLIRLVDQVLLVHHGPILQFKLISRHLCNDAIGRWMLILSRNGIKNLSIELGGSVEMCKIPSSYFSCLALEHVLISNSTIIHVPRSILGFKYLCTLSLLRFEETGINVARLISSCPLLESLELSNFVKFDCLVIRALNLTWLRIEGEFGDLCLETPKLRFARIYLEDSNCTMPSEDCESNISRVLGSLSAIEELELWGDFTKYLAEEPIPEALPLPFYRLTKLYITLYSYKEEIAAVFCLFKSAPNLKVLSLVLGEEESGPPSSLAQSVWEVKGIQSDFLNFLEIVEIIDYENLESILEFAKFVMSTAPVLEKLKIRKKNICLAFLKKMESFPRLSKMAKIVFFLMISYEIKKVEIVFFFLVHEVQQDFKQLTLFGTTSLSALVALTYVLLKLWIFLCILIYD